LYKFRRNTWIRTGIVNLDQFIFRVYVLEVSFYANIPILSNIATDTSLHETAALLAVVGALGERPKRAVNIRGSE
jgi:hypothetical protein